MKLFIKYMVSDRCKMLVQEEFKKQGLHSCEVTLGVDIKENISEEQRKQIKTALLKLGLELLEDKKGILIEKIKNQIIAMVYNIDDFSKTNFSDYLSKALRYSYTHLTKLFSESTGITIEHFFIINKIERAKELIIYGELNLTEIAFELNYSSVAHLSNQFKKVTGLTPSFFKSLKKKKSLQRKKVKIM